MTPDSSYHEPERTIREMLGLPHLFRSLGFAFRAAGLACAFVGLCATLFYGTCVLDPVAGAFGAQGLSPHAIDQFRTARQSGEAYEEPVGEFGIFEVFRRHQRRALLGMLGAPSSAGRSPTTIQAVRLGATSHFASFGYGFWWLMRCHFLYFLFLAAGTLVIWSLCGGAICRIAAVQFARDEQLSIAHAFDHAREHWGEGYVLAPCVPLFFIAIFAALMMLFGAVLRLPVVGDLLGGATFFLMILLGFGVALLAVGSAAGASLFWPAVAIEGSDWFDAFKDGLQLPLARLWKALWYALVTVVFGIFCWHAVRLFTYMLLVVTRGIVSFGTSPWGFWNRGTEQSPISKLALLWPMSGSDAMYAWPDWSRLSWYECISGALIGVYVLVVLGLMWSFLISYYFSASTIIYFLLRRDVDGTDLQELRGDDLAPTEHAEERVEPATDALPATEPPKT